MRKMQIRRRCKCGCGNITNPGNKYIHGHTWKGKNRSEGTIKKMSVAQMGNVNALGYKHSEEAILKISIAKQNISGETKLKQSISKIKYDPDYEYCDVWKDCEYRKDLRKDYCENINCKNNYKRLVNHHIDLNKKNCHPNNIMTLCVSCHVSLHRKLEDGKIIIVNPKDFVIINRPDHISYINKKTGKKIKIKRVI